jgi:hypothetical protein
MDIKKYFEENPDVEKVYQTTDGCLFKDQNKASWNQTHRLSSKEDVKVFFKESFIAPKKAEKPAEKPAKLTAQERIDLVMQAQTIEELETLKEGETAKTVLEAIENRTTELNNS